MSKSPSISHSLRDRAATAVLVGILALFVGLGARLVQINTSLRPRLLNVVQRQRNAHSVLPACRGMILDAAGRVVAVSRRMPDVFVDPSRVEDVTRFSDRLAARIQCDPKELADRIAARKSSRFLVVSRHVDDATAEAVLAMGHPAIGLTRREKRSYPLGTSMAHVLGFVSRYGRGLEGIERYFDAHLRGEDGRRGLIVDGRRRALWAAEQPERLASDGGHVVLSLDAQVQAITETALARAVDRFDAESGVAIVMSPINGDILAMASLPVYDPADGALATADSRRNRAVTDPVEPGSTFKPFIACGALEGGFVTTTELIDCHHGVFRLRSRTIRDSSSHGLLDLAGIITFSSNIGMSQIGERMGNDALCEIVRRFGFGRKTGIAFPGEAMGLVRPVDRWGSMSAASVAFGYEITVTPLQLITAFCAIVNDGVLVPPRIVKRLLDSSGGDIGAVVEERQNRRVVSKEIARYMARELLVSVVQRGTGTRAKIDGYAVLGKTGTARLPFHDKPGYEPRAYQAAFLGAAPADDPRVAVVIVIRRPDPNLGYSGGKVAAPAAAEILAGTLEYFGIPRTEDARVAGL